MNATKVKVGNKTDLENIDIKKDMLYPDIDISTERFNELRNIFHSMLMQNKRKSFLTIEEVSKVLTLSKQTVRKLIEFGKIKHFKMGKQYRINIDDLIDYMVTTTDFRDRKEIEKMIYSAIERSVWCFNVVE